MAPEELRSAFINALMNIWPLGTGLNLEGSLGATFGIPLYLGMGLDMTAIHNKQGVIEFRKTGFIEAAMDSGVGAGVVFGKGGRGAGSRKAKLGARAEAEARAGLRLFSIQHFNFPVVEEPEALISFVQAVFTIFPSYLGKLEGDMAKLDADNYNTMSKVVLKAFGEVDANAMAGVATGDAGKKRKRTWSKRSGAPQEEWWQNLEDQSQVALSGNAAVEAGVGVEIRTLERKENADGVKVPTRQEVDVFGEVSGALSASLSVPYISTLLPEIPELNAGMGVRITWDLNCPPDGKEPKLASPRWSVYAMSGDFDKYVGSAHELALQIQPTNPKAILEDVRNVLSAVKGVSYKRRVDVGNTFGAKFIEDAKRKGAFISKIPEELGKLPVFRLEGYLDLESELQEQGAQQLLRVIVAEYRDVGALQLIKDVLSALTSGDVPDTLEGAPLDTIADLIRRGVKKLALHSQAGPSISGSGRVSKGAKVRLEGEGSLMVVVEFDLLKYAQGQLTTDDIKGILQGDVEEEGFLDLANRSPGGGSF